MRRFVALVLALSIAAPAGALAQGESAADVETLARRANEMYKAGQHTEAVSLYLKAWQAAPAAALLYNIAHIYDRKLGERELAIDFYRKYITSPDADPTVVARATERIQALKQAPDTKPPPATPPPVATLSEDEPSTETGTASTASAATSTSSGGSSQRTWGYVAAGTGAALLVGGGVLGYLASQKADDFAASDDLETKRTARDDGRAQALTADVLMGVGLAAGVAGAVLLLTAEDAHVSAMVTPHGGFVHVGGAL